MGTGPGAECNGNDAACDSGGGDLGGGGGGGGCTIQFGDTCPAQCSSCEYQMDW